MQNGIILPPLNKYLVPTFVGGAKVAPFTLKKKAILAYQIARNNEKKGTY